MVVSDAGLLGNDAEAVFAAVLGEKRRGRKGGVAYHRWWLAMLASGGDLAIFSKGLHKASNARPQAFL